VFNGCREWFSDKPGSSSAGLLLLSKVTVELKLGLPQVAVVGSQSSGKSSVLEALVRSHICIVGVAEQDVG
jgi:GTP-binding protein EngB required for normal cell division